MRSDEIKAVFDQQAASYDERWARTAPIRNALHFLLEAVFAPLPAEARVLCIGAGTGEKFSGPVPTRLDLHRGGAIGRDAARPSRQGNEPESNSAASSMRATWRHCLSRPLRRGNLPAGIPVHSRARRTHRLLS